MSHGFDHAQSHAFGSACAKYQRWYDQIIENARTRPSIGRYHEVHHVVPRAMGGNDDPENLVELTYREHFLVHWLLTKLHSGYEHRLMLYALHCMTMQIGGRIIAGWQFEVVKRALKNEAMKRMDLRRRERQARLKVRRKELAAKALEGYHQAANPANRYSRRDLSRMANDIIVGQPNKLSRLGARRPRRGKRGETWHDELRRILNQK